MTRGSRARSRTPSRRARTALVLGSPLAVSGCLPAAATSEAEAIRGLYDVFMLLAVIVAAVVWVPLTWALLRHRRRDDSLPRQVRGNVRLELVWTLIPAAVVLALFGGTMITLSRVEGGPDVGATQAPAGSVRVDIEAFRWGWRFAYPDTGVVVTGATGVAPELVIPASEPVRFTVVGVDVVHSFYVPQFLFKRDAIPGRPSMFVMTVEQPGVYGGQCAEFCGVYHARMPFTVRALPRAEFDAWLSAQRHGGS